MKNKFIHKGQCFMITAGEYSDYGCVQFLVAIETFNPSQVLPPRDEYDLYSHEKYCLALITKKLAVPLEYAELYIGDYGRIDPEIRRGSNDTV